VVQVGGEKLYNLKMKVLRKKPVRLGEYRFWIRGIRRSLALAAAFAGHEMQEGERRAGAVGRGEGLRAQSTRSRGSPRAEVVSGAPVLGRWQTIGCSACPSRACRNGIGDRIWRGVHPWNKRKHWLPSRSDFIVDGKGVKYDATRCCQEKLDLAGRSLALSLQRGYG
jgi:hypothetical protein